MNRHASTWRDGDIVSARGTKGIVLGKVVVLRRQSDGREYRKVQITSGGAIGKWEWPDDWALGSGSRAASCLECGQPFRTDDAQEDFCLACNRIADAYHAGHGDSNQIRKGRAYLHGAQTISRPQPVSEETKARQAAHAASIRTEDPF